MIRVRLLAALLPASLCVALPARAARFTILDQIAARELGETTRIYLDGVLVATVSLDPATTREIRIPVSLPNRPGADGRHHDYALCGEIAIRHPDGARELHRVDGGGVLNDPDGHTFLALGAADFTRFFLADPEDPAAVTIRPGPSGFCQTPIS